MIWPLTQSDAFDSDHRSGDLEQVAQHLLAFRIDVIPVRGPADRPLRTESIAVDIAAAGEDDDAVATIHRDIAEGPRPVTVVRVRVDDRTAVGVQAQDEDT